MSDQKKQKYVVIENISEGLQSITDHGYSRTQFKVKEKIKIVIDNISWVNAVNMYNALPEADFKVTFSEDVTDVIRPNPTIVESSIPKTDKASVKIKELRKRLQLKKKLDEAERIAQLRKESKEKQLAAAKNGKEASDEGLISEVKKEEAKVKEAELAVEKEKQEIEVQLKKEQEEIAEKTRLEAQEASAKKEAEEKEIDLNAESIEAINDRGELIQIADQLELKYRSNATVIKLKEIIISSLPTNGGEDSK